MQAAARPGSGQRICMEPTVKFFVSNLGWAFYALAGRKAG